MPRTIRRLVLLITCCLGHYASNAQNFDSLWGVWNDTTLAPLERLRAMSYISLDGYLYKTKLDSGYLLAQMQYDLAVKSGNLRYQGISLNTQGEYFGMKGNYAAMLDRFERSLKLFEKGGDMIALSKIQSNMGVLLQQLGAREKAHEFYVKSAELAQRMHDTTAIATAKINIGSLVLEEGDTVQAAIEFEQVVALLNGGMNDRDLCIALGNLGLIRSHTGIASEAHALHERSLQLAETLDQDDLRIMALKNLASHEIRHGAWERGVELANQALKLARMTGLPKETSDAANLLYEAYRTKGNSREALAMFELAEQMEDSLRQDEGKKELQRFTYEKKAFADSLANAAALTQVKNERTIAELRAERNRNRAWGAGSGGVLLLGGLGAWTITDRKRRKERFEKEAATLETQALRSQMNPHFIFNALNSVNAYVLDNDTENATGFLTKFAKVMRSVLENSRHAEVPLQDDLDTLRGYMDLERKRMHEKFDYRVEVDPAIDPQSVMVPPLVVQPFVENAIWHGMAGKKSKGLILLKVDRHGDQLVWTIEDDGTGRHPKKSYEAEGIPTKKTSLGTTITRARLDLVQKQYGGKAGFLYTDLPQGTRVVVTMPLMQA